MLFNALRGNTLNRNTNEITLPGRGLVPQPLMGPMTINPNSVLAITTAYRAVQLLSDTIAGLPLQAIRDNKVIGANPRLLTKPNMMQTRVETIAQIVTSMAIDGNAYCVLGDRNQLGYPQQLLVLNPSAVTVNMSNDGVVVYRANNTGIDSSDIMHIKAGVLQPGALEGYGPIHTQRQAFATALACEEQAAQLHVTGSIPAGTLETEAELTADEAQQLQDAFTASHGGRNKKPAILSGGIKYNPISFSNEQLQWIDSRKYSASQIASMFGCPAWLIGAPDNGTSKTYSNITQDLRAFVQFTLQGYISRIEAALSEQLPNGQTAKFDLDELLRSDRLTRYNAHAVALSNGFLSVDEVRESEDLDIEQTQNEVFEDVQTD